MGGKQVCYCDLIREDRPNANPFQNFACLNAYLPLTYSYKEKLQDGYDMLFHHRAQLEIFGMAGGGGEGA